VNTVLWMLQVLLALAFGLAGLAKLVRSREALEPRMPWVSAFPTWAVTSIGAAEVAGSAALVLPGALGIVTVLVPVAAGCLAVLMLGAVATHLVRKEPPEAVPATVLMVLATVLAATRGTGWPL
jgi:tellurite resistance protein TehA-like permease